MRSDALAGTAGSTEGGRNGVTRYGLIAPLLVCLVALLGIGAPAASAAPEAELGWSFQRTFGKVDANNFEPTYNPLAVDGAGNVYGLVSSSGKTNGYRPDGSLFGEYGFTNEVQNLTADQAEEVVYVDNVFGGPITRWVSDGEQTPTYTRDPGFSVPGAAGLAVDPTTHDLLVADPAAEAVQRYDTTGALVGTIKTSISPVWVAVAPDGSIYIASEAGPDVLHLSGSGALLGTISGLGTVKGLAVDPVGEILAVAAGGMLKSFTATGQLISEVKGASAAFGLATSLTGRLYQLDGQVIDAYSFATFPGVEPPAVSNVQPHSVHLSAEVDPGVDPGGSPGDPPPAGSSARFEYSADGGKTWNSTPDQSLTAPGTVTIEAELTGLLVNFEYLVRVKASNPLASSTGIATSFSTPETAPEVVTGNATDVGEAAAVLNGTINPAGQQTTYHFEYGTTIAYGFRVPEQIEAVAGGTRAARIFSRTIRGLEPGTTYHYRLVATNATGIRFGEDRTFTTVASGGVPHRAYEQVTPVDKHGNPLTPGFGFQTNADGSAIAYINSTGKQSSPLASYAMSLREATDWRAGIDLSAPLNVEPEFKAAIINGTTLAISPDFTHTFVATNRALAPGAVEGGCNLYLHDVETGSYTLVGKNPISGYLLSFVAVQMAFRFQRGASDFSWIVFESEAPLIEGAPPRALYRWSTAGGLEVISKLPDGELAATTTGGSDKIPPIRTVSADGSRVYFTVPTGFGSENGVFLYEPGKGTKAVSISHLSPAAEAEPPKDARLMGISQDGRYAFLLSTEEAPLTPGAPPVTHNEEEAGGLYRYDADDGSLEYTGLSAFAGGAFYFTSALGVSDDGDTAYFVTPSGVAVWRQGVTHLIQNLSHVEHFAETSPNGRYFVYETGSHTNGETGDVYLYDAETDQKSCASCLPDGSPGDAYLPEIERYVSNQLSKAVTDTGEVFFTTASRLVAADVNGSKDIYMFKDGKPSLISPGNLHFDATLADISEDGSNVFFVTAQKLVGRDNDESPDIYDARINGGLPAQSPPPAQECLRDDCKATPNGGPELPFGGSEALSGPGNISVKAPAKRCTKGSVSRKIKGKQRCVKQSKSKKKPANKKAAKRTDADRRQGR